MIVRAKLNNYRMSSRKVRLVANLVRGKKTEDALVLLAFTKKQAAPVIATLIKSALANAKNNYNLENKDLVIKEITVDEAVTYKRWMPRAMGRATPIRKRGAHIAIALAIAEAKEEKKVVKAKKKAVKKVAVKKVVAKKVVAKKTVSEKASTTKKVKVESKKSETDNK